MTWPIAAAGTVSLPLLAAGAMAVIPARHGAWVSGAAAVATVACTGFLPWATAEPDDILLTDGLAAHLAILAGFIGLTTAWAGFRSARHHPALSQLSMGLIELALLSDDVGLAWIAAAAVAMLATGMRVGPGLLPTAAGVLMALFGTVLLYLAAVAALGPGWAAMRWTSLAAAAPKCQGGPLSLAFLLILAGYGGIAALAPRYARLGGTAANVLLPVVAFSVILRLRNVMAVNADAILPGPLLAALGMGALLLGALGLWRRDRLIVASAIGHNGIVATAFGLGGPAAIFAGLLHLTAHSLAHAALRHPLSTVPFAALLTALAGLPPFALFGSEALILTEATRRLPWLALPFGLGLLAIAAALAVRLRDRPGPVVSPGHAAFAWVWLHVAALLGLGVAMPARVATWLHAIAATP